MTGSLDDRTARTLDDMLSFAGEIDTFVISRGEKNFHSNRETQLVAEALLHRLGEAVSRLPDEFIDDHPEVEWEKMRGMRNVVAHQCGFIDYRIVWRALDAALPKDVAAIARILSND